MTHDFRVVPAAYVFLRRGEDVLLQLRKGTGYMDDHWAAAAAGHVEANESVFAAACREAVEELGLTIDPAHLKPLTTMHRTHANNSPIDERVDFFFECRSWEGEPRLLETQKAADLGWFSLDALPHPVVPHEKYVLDRLHAGRLDPIVSFGF
ncbi:8-oxo-dGTP pyrophosphatase MutT (NUDIX family) [Cryobacterium mesophilum]|uniref:NUDIX domain-containing protein n=1 Tax=Terrimesophilobacter mesophilus TaxID=433647 RepID=A0A4R8VFA3_9MICO|nr:NUDIX domain-containing protein [Terrimesophilobacter mesophilus]MBB5633839.1 8-oxo-dGTP pyrophosphatase MutT (NUDIX family) [Terrimesophilobacter mesophilus]TFB80517.1 NUDIX domain-containing protein [Terrimesophilobacter mesophilus]